MAHRRVTAGCFSLCALLGSGCLQPVLDCTSDGCADDSGAIIDAGGAGTIGEADAGLTESGEFAGTWDVLFECTINCVGDYPHTMTITSWDRATGAFSGSGSYKVDSSYTWTVTGNISPPNVSFTLVYTGSNYGYTARQTGALDPSGKMSGTGTTSQNQTHAWSATRRP